MELFLRMKIIVSLAVLLHSVAYYAVLLNLPAVIKQIIKHDRPHIDPDSLIADASSVKSLCDGTTALVTLFMLPIMGALSDTYGRKPMLLFGSITLGISLLFFIAAFKLNIMWGLILCKALGFGTMTFISLCSAYVSDIIDAKGRSKGFGRIYGVHGLAMVVAPLMYDAVTHYFGLLFSVALGAGMCVMDALLIALFLPESLHYRKDMEASRKSGLIPPKPNIWRRINPFGTWGIVLGKNAYVTCLSVIYIFYAFGESDILETAMLYTNYRYGWDTSDYSLYLTATGTLLMLYQGLLMGFVTKRAGERKVLKAVLFISAISHIVYAFAFKWYIFIAAIPFACTVNMAGTAIFTLITKSVPEKDVGGALAAVGSFFELSLFLGALIMENILSYTIDSIKKGKFHSKIAQLFLPGCHLLLGSFFLFSGAIFACILFHIYPNTKKGADESTRLLAPPPALSIQAEEAAILADEME